MRVFLFKIFFIISIFPFLLSQDKNARFNRISVEEGLSQNSINCIFQDSRGFIWLGTMDGLNKFDGYNFSVYRHEPGNLNSLSDYAVNDIAEDKDGILWIATREGLNRFNPQTESFETFKYISGSSNTLSNNFIHSLCVDDKNILWIGTRDGLNSFEIKSGKFEVFRNDSTDQGSISSNFVSVVYKSIDGSIWAGTAKGLNRFIREKRKFVLYEPGSAERVNIISLTEVADNNLWVCTTRGLYILNFAEEKLDPYINQKSSLFPENFQIRSLTADKSGYLWIAGSQGLYKLKYDSGEFTHYSHDENDRNSISSDNLKSIFVDNSGVVWIGSVENGLNKFSPGSRKFIHIKNDQGTDYNFVQSFYRDKKNNIWIGTEGGLNVIAEQALLDGGNIFDKINIESKGYVLKSVTSVIQDDKENYWVGTFGSGLFKLDNSGKLLNHYLQDNSDQNSLSHNYIHTLYFDKKGILWIGTGLGGLVRYDPEENVFKTYRFAGKDKTLPITEVTSITEDGRDNLWAGTTTGGLFKLSRKREKFYHYNHAPADRKSLSSTRINTLFIDHSGTLWIGTFGGGLNKFNQKENSFVSFSTKDGLPGNTIFAIAEDQNGKLWLSTSKGICRFDPESNIFRIFDINEGLQGNEYIQNAVYTNPEKRYICFGGLNGFNLFYPDSIREDKFLPPVAITDFRIFNKSVPPGYFDDGRTSPLSRHISFTKELFLPYEDNVFSFEFASLHFANPGKNLYAYRMEGFDKEWIYSGNVRTASYTNLDPGRYVFKVKGSNSDGVWSSSTARLIVNILPPWWQTWWAYLVYGLVILTVLFSARKYEMNRIKLRNDLKRKEFEAEKLSEVDRMKSRFFANISHEFRTPLTLILGILDKYLNKSPDSNADFRIMKKNAYRLLHLINQLLELSKIESGNADLKVQQTDLCSFIRRISSSFISLSEQHQVEIYFNDIPLPKADGSREIFAFVDRDKMETVIYNLLSNAIKFTPADEKIFIDLRADSERAEIKITNTGVGIPQEKIPFIFNRFYQADESDTRGFEGTGIGLALVKELVELHQGEIMAESIPGVETTFKIYLPLGKHYKPEQVADIPEEDGEKLLKPVNEESFIRVESDSREDKVLLSKPQTKVSSGIILVVEDHFDLRNFICDQLEDEYTVIEAEDGQKGLRLAEDLIPDLVVSDIMMPEMNGYQLCRELKTNIKTNHIPVVLLIAKASLENKMEGLETGADDYLVKPFNTAELRTRIRNLIRNRQQMREKFQNEMKLKPSEIIVPSTQKVFIEKLINIIEAHIEDENFSVEILCKEIGMSRAQLHRKIKAVANQSATEFIRSFRLQRAADLIRQDAGNMAEIAYKAGFNSQAYFTKSFQDYYGCTPGEFKRKQFQVQEEGR